MNAKRNSRRIQAAAVLTVTASAGLVLLASPASAHPAPHPKPAPSTHTVVATGLNNPRGLAVEGDHLVYVSQAGTAGVSTDCFQANAGAEETCLSASGSITRFEKLGKNGQKSVDVVTGLLSIENRKTGEVVGIDGISLRGEHDLFGIMAESTPGLTEEFAGADGGTYVPPTALGDAVNNFAGRLVQFKKKHGVFSPKALADVGTNNWNWSDTNTSQSWAPTGQFPDSNPYAVVAEGDKYYVVDAGSNTVSVVKKNHKPASGYSQQIISYIPNPLAGSDAAPTCIAKKGRYLYVGELNFASFYGLSTPASTVYRIDTKATDPQTSAVAWATGFNPITGCGFAKDNFYVVELRTGPPAGANGDIVRVAVNEDGSAGTHTTFATDLVDPSGFARLHNTIIVANKSTSTGAGEIWQFKI
jgi:hypothetical protein